MNFDGRKEWRRARRNVWQGEINKLKMDTGCQWPGCDFQVEIPEQLEFAHIDQHDKGINISRLLEYSPHVLANRQRLEAEIAKCRILCANHHRIETVLGEHAAHRRGTKPKPSVLQLA